MGTAIDEYGGVVRVGCTRGYLLISWIPPSLRESNNQKRERENKNLFVIEK